MNGDPRAPSGASAPNPLHPSASASPATHPNVTSQAPNGHPPRPRRRRPQTDPMRPVHRPLKQIARPMVSLTQMNQTAKPPVSQGPATNDGSKSLEALRQEYLARGAMSIPLVVARKDLKELRHHVMRLQGKGRVDVQDDEQFAPPIRLHRRDPRAPSSGANAILDEEEIKEELEETRERERLELAKEERRKIREENQAKIAPTATKKPPAFQKKTEQKFRPDDTPEAEKRRLLKYEETLPWHLEDFDNKQTWVGTYESELSESHVMLTTAYENGRDIIQMVPMERWYKFSVKGKGKQNTADQVDEAWKKLEKIPKFLSNIEQISIKREQERTRGGGGRMRTRVGGAGEDEGAPRRRGGDDDDAPTIKREADADDIDFNLEEDFADDEEGLNGLFEGEEADVKDAAERLRRDQLAAAAFELRNEEEIYRQDERDRLEAEEQRKLEKSLRKALTKREKNLEYAEDSDSNPYASSSDDETDSETERQRAKEEEERKAAEQNGKVDGDKPASGTSTKGSNTPSGVHKTVDFNKKKRPGSPNLSEASGNESSRKKHKKKHDKHADGSRKSTLMRGAASGSDSEMTDASKPKKSKMKSRLGGSSNGSPGGSRAGSPAASQMNGSRAGSPASSGGAASQQKVLPTATEIYKALPAQGMTIKALLAAFKDRVDKHNTQVFIRLVKAVSSFDRERGWIMPLPSMPSEEHINSVMRVSKPKPKSAAASPS